MSAWGSTAVSIGGRILPATRAGRLLVLIYHRVRAEVDPMFVLEPTAAEFDWQMQLLARHCAPVSLNDAMQMLARGTLPQRAVAVTFDDGYADNAQVALPILAKYRVPATFFVATGYLDGGLMWNDVVIESLRGAKAQSMDLTALGLGVATLGSPAARGALAERIIREIKHLAAPLRAERVRGVQAAAGTKLPSDLMMSSLQVQQLAGAGMEIGAHTVTHPILRVLSEERAREEIETSRLRLESLTSRPVVGFAYPNGKPGADYDTRDRDLVAGLGFGWAVSTRAGVATKGSDRFQLPRFTPWDRTQDRWLARLLLTYGKAA